MQMELYRKMGLPENCLVGKRVYKKLFYVNADLTAGDKKILQEDVETIYWQYALKPDTIQIQPYQDREREYTEVAVLQANLKQTKRYRRLAEIIHRTIPYPVILVFAQKAPDNDSSENQTTDSSCAISLAPKRFSRSEQGAVIAEEFFTSPWIDPANPAPVEQDFFDSLHLSALPLKNFSTFYQALADRLFALQCARLTGKYRLEKDEEKHQKRRQRLAASMDLEKKIRQLRKELQQESRFNRKVELNARIKNFEQQLNKIIQEI